MKKLRISRLYTLRTEEEGDNLRRRDYYSIVREIIILCSVEVVDIEAFDRWLRRRKVEFLVNLAHDKCKKVIFSNHDFRKIPDGRKSSEDYHAGAVDGYSKMAMPREERDVLVLLEAARLAGRR